MSRFFEELDYQPTAIGPISLRRRRELRLDVDVLEILLGDEHLMSDLFTTSEVALAEHGLGAIADNRPLSASCRRAWHGLYRRCRIERPAHRKPYHCRKAGTGDWLA